MIGENRRTHSKRSILWRRTMKCLAASMFLAGFFGIPLTAETILELPLRAAEEIKAWRGARAFEIYLKSGSGHAFAKRHF